MDVCCITSGEQGSYRLNGEFSKFTIPENNRFMQGLFKNHEPSVLHLENVSSCDSALVALLISYKHDYPHLQLSHPSEQLQKLFALYNVEDWF